MNKEKTVKNDDDDDNAGNDGDDDDDDGDNGCDDGDDDDNDDDDDDDDVDGDDGNEREMIREVIKGVMKRRMEGGYMMLALWTAVTVFLLFFLAKSKAKLATLREAFSVISFMLCTTPSTICQRRQGCF